jgi:hypothetical protein
LRRNERQLQKKWRLQQPAPEEKSIAMEAHCSWFRDQMLACLETEGGPTRGSMEERVGIAGRLNINGSDGNVDLYK